MFMRNWLSLSRKIVDRYDLNTSFTAVQQALGEYALAWFGEGVVITSKYPNPFLITTSNISLGGSVSYGVAFDSNGQITGINSNSTSSNAFTLAPSDPTNFRYDLICIQYLSSGDTPVPKPSDPLTTVYLNLHDDFQLVVVTGTPATNPVYPAKGNPLYIVLGGVQVPPSAITGSQCTVDYTPREAANANLAQYPVVKQEIPSGVINGINETFTLSQSPINASSVLVKCDGLLLTQGADYSILGQVLTLNPAPALGQILSVWYIVNSAQSTNPFAGVQETPTGAINGINDTFVLTGTPADQNATQVFVDGLNVEVAGWDLIQGSGYNAILFNPDYIPQTGQSVTCFYLANPFVFGIQPPVIAPVGSGGLVAYGNAISPIIVAATAGILSTPDQRQLWIVKSAGGPQVITANPQITPGSIVGQEMYIQGVSTTDYIIFSDGAGLSLNGPISLTNNAGIDLIWNGVSWYETSRR
jgi:hypothetical protein